ncbi:archaemetzincin [Nannocystis exedens]|uniref:Archaemetzincin n=1 Tax=Nannocystis exedens TaxID=54 RepID=A0A1I2CCA9_9BACT|nr:archaemetzincin [Nannocystis exedens]PCC68413.1 Peptidase family M54 [Nannocystis exedens]SFE65443.1 archaemetzincin [Nannocystis exedens]
MPVPRRSLLRALLAAPVAIAPSLAQARKFSPPDGAARLRALGALDPLPPDLQAAFTPGDDDRPIPRPGPQDWLAQHREPGQTFAQFVGQRHHRPTETRRKLSMLPIGALEGGEWPALSVVADFAARYFQLPVERLAPTSMAALKARRRDRGGYDQYHTGTILAGMKRRVPADAHALIAVTTADLYPDSGWNFVFGYASFDERVGVYSFARFDPAFYGEARGPGARAKILRRGLGLLVHEVGHMFGLYHCVHFHCIMNGCNHLDESDRAPLHLCPVCRRKLQYAIAFDPAVRERELAEFFRAHAMVDDAARSERLLAAIAAAAPAP